MVRTSHEEGTHSPSALKAPVETLLQVLAELRGHWCRSGHVDRRVGIQYGLELGMGAVGLGSIFTSTASDPKRPFVGLAACLHKKGAFT